MALYYVSNANLPGKKAHTIQQMQMCQSFSRLGENVQFVHPSHETIGKHIQWSDVADYYGLTTRFSIKTLPSLQDCSHIPGLVGLITMTSSLAGWLFTETLKGDLSGNDVVYSRNYYPTFAFCELCRFLPKSRRPTIVLEYHDKISAYMKPRFFRSIDDVIAITDALKQYGLKTYELKERDVFVAPDGVDVEPYRDISQSEARKQLALPRNGDIAMYTGHLYRGKGAAVLAEATNHIGADVYIVGGYDEDIERVKQRTTPNGEPEFTGYIHPADVPLYQLAADVLVAPYTEEARDFVSPLKLFEYMAAERPIVSSNLPVLKEVLTHKENAMLAKPGDARDLATHINEVLRNDALAGRLAKTASEQVKQYTWDRRAERILSFI